MTDHPLSAAEAAEKLGIAAATVRRLCDEGKLPARKWNGRWVIERRDLARFRKIERRPYWVRSLTTSATAR